MSYRKKVNSLKLREIFNSMNVHIHSGITSAMTYIIVDQNTKTRTCLHTPLSEDLTADDVKDFASTFNNAALLFLDSRQPHAALSLAKAAVDTKVPIFLDAGKKDPSSPTHIQTRLTSNTQYRTTKVVSFEYSQGQGK